MKAFRGSRLALSFVAWSCFACGVHAEPFAYFAQWGSGPVQTIDVATNQVSATGAGQLAVSVVVAPVGHRAYMVERAPTSVPPSTSYLTVMDTVSNVVVNRVTVPFDPWTAAISADGQRVFILGVGTFGSGCVPSPPAFLCPAHPYVQVGRLAVYDTRAEQLVDTSVAFPYPNAVAFDDRRNRLYIYDGVALTAVDAANWAVAWQLPMPGAARDMAFDAVNDRLYVAQGMSNSVAVIDLGTHRITDTISLPAEPHGIAVHPSGTPLLVATDSGLQVFDAATRSLVKTFAFGAHGVGITPDGAFAYATYGAAAAPGSGTFVTAIRMQDLTRVIDIPLYTNPSPRGQFIGGLSAPVDQTPGPLTGLWWNAQQSGWGLHLTQRMSTVFGAWFTYDEQGRSKWYVAPACRMQPALLCQDCVTNSFCTGELYETRGPRFFLDPFTPQSVNNSRVGTMQIDFRDKDHAHLTYVVGGQVNGVDIEREVFGSGSAPTVNYTDLWYNALESGWGMGVVQQGRTMFVAWYNYSDFGQPVWNVVSNCAVHDDGNGCSGRVYRASGPMGPSTGKPFNPSSVSAADVGWIELRFFGANNGQVRWQVDGRDGQRAIVRQVF